MKKILQTLALSFAVLASTAASAQETTIYANLEGNNKFAKALNKVLPETANNKHFIEKSASFPSGQGTQKIVVSCSTSITYPRGPGEGTPSFSGCVANLLDETPAGVPEWTMFDLFKAAKPTE